MLQPKKTKYRKTHRGRLKWNAVKWSLISFWDYAIKTTTRWFITSRQIEASRRAMVRALKRWWKVYTEIIPNAKAKILIPIIRWKIDDWSIINTDWWKAYDGLVDLWYEKHFRVHHWKNEFARWKQHINFRLNHFT